MSQEEFLAGPCPKQFVTGHLTAVMGVRFSPCATRPAGGTLDGSVVVWDAEDLGRCIANDAHFGSVLSVCSTPNSALVTSAGSDRSIGFWRPEANGTSIIFEGHRKCIRSVDFDPTGTLVRIFCHSLGICSFIQFFLHFVNDKTLKIWSVNDSQCLFVVAWHSDWVRDAKFSPNGQLIASCGDDKKLRVRDVNSGIWVFAIKDEIGMGRKVAWHPGGYDVAVALTNNRVKIFDIFKGKYSQDYEVHSASLSDIDFHPSGAYLLTSGDDDGKQFATADTDRKATVYGGNMK